MSMWEPFTQHARRAVAAAAEETMRPGYVGAIEPEDLLLGILAAGDNTASAALASMGVDLASARRIVHELSAPHQRIFAENSGGERVFSQNAKQCIELAFGEARSLQQNFIGPEHLLLAIMRLNESVQSPAISRLCPNPSELRQKLGCSAEPQKSGKSQQSGGEQEPVRPTFLYSRVRQRSQTSSLWEPFTEDARQTIVLAREAADERGNNLIGNEHILLGMLSLTDGVGHDALQSAGITKQKLQPVIDEMPVGRGAASEIVFSPSAKRTIEHAFAMANQLQQRFISSGHLLLGVLADSDQGKLIFDRLGVNKEKLQAQIVERLKKL